MKTCQICLVFVLVSLSCVHAQLSEKYSEYHEGFYKSTRYGLFEPEDYDWDGLYPLVVHLHGSSGAVFRDSLWYKKAYAVRLFLPCY